MQINLKNEKIFTILLLFFSAVLYWVSTTHGVNFAGGDSMYYYETAELFQRGEGVFKSVHTPLIAPHTHWIPCSAWIVGAVTWIFSMNLLTAFRLVNGIFLLANIFLFKILIGQHLEKKGFVLLGTLLFSLHFATISCHSELSSEPAFMFFMLGGFIVWNFFEKNEVDKYLIGVGFLFGWAAAMRYIGVVLAMPVLLCLIKENGFKKSNFIKKTFFFLLPFSVCPILMSGRNLYFFGASTDRIFVFHPFNLRNILQLGQTILGWFSPLLYEKTWFGVGILVSLLGFSFFMYLFFKNKPIWRSFFEKIPFIYRAFLVTYLAFLVFSISFFDAYTDMGLRILYPIFPFFVIISFAFLVEDNIKVWEKTSLILLYLTTSLTHTTHFVQHNAYSGEAGSLSTFIKNDQGITFLKENYNEKAIYSDIPDILKINGVQNVHFVPRLFDPSSLKKNPRVSQEIAANLNEVLAQKAIFVFSKKGVRNYLINSKNIDNQAFITMDSLHSTVFNIFTKP